ncbi:MAG: hydrogenase small subunit [Anaerolineales bacterium]|nr:MAG: hydrogenase small subunit [Anaerolineales bacterium]
MPTEIGGLKSALIRRGMARRDFLKFCAAMTAVLALPSRYVPRVAAALEGAARPPLLWLEYQDCAGNTESVLRASKPTVAELVLDVLSLDYHETVMAAAGHQAEKSLMDTVEAYKGQYLVVVEGSIPTKDGGIYCTVGGRTALDLVQEIGGNAAAIIAAGTCAAYGGIPAAAPNPTGAVGVKDLVNGVPVINLPGCPMNVQNLTAVVVHYRTVGAWPATDQRGRPMFAYGSRIHDDCERRAHFDAGQFVEDWGDHGHRKGWCLYKMGCKGPETFHNCPIVRWNDGTSWPIGAGHGCVGCSEPNFWDTMSPFYERLPNVPGFGVEATADKVGLGIVAGVTGVFALHGVASAIRAKAQPVNRSKVEVEEE